MEQLVEWLKARMNEEQTGFRLTTCEAEAHRHAATRDAFCEVLEYLDGKQMFTIEQFVDMFNEPIMNQLWSEYMITDYESLYLVKREEENDG